MHRVKGVDDIVGIANAVVIDEVSHATVLSPLGFIGEVEVFNLAELGSSSLGHFGDGSCTEPAAVTLTLESDGEGDLRREAVNGVGDLDVGSSECLVRDVLDKVILPELGKEDLGSRERVHKHERSLDARAISRLDAEDTKLLDFLFEEVLCAWSVVLSRLWMKFTYHPFDLAKRVGLVEVGHVQIVDTHESGLDGDGGLRAHDLLAFATCMRRSHDDRLKAVRALSVAGGGVVPGT